MKATVKSEGSEAVGKQQGWSFLLQRGEVILLFNKIFPCTIDNKYRGHVVALYAFYVATLATVVRSCVHIFAPDGGAQSIATIPLDTYSAQAANAVVFVFALWGLSQLLIGVLYVIVLFRYKSLIPLMYLSLVAEYLGRLLIGHFKPVELAGTAPGGVGNYLVFPLMLLLFFLSVAKKPITLLYKDGEGHV